jgi:hypothetical protein
VGNDPMVLATMFAIKHKKLSSAIISENGVFVVWINSENAALNNNPDIDGLKTQMMTELKGRVEGLILEALKTSGNIKDYRYKYM